MTQAVDQYVLRLHVTVHDSSRVRGGEGIGRLARQIGRGLHREWAVLTNNLGQGGGLHGFHHQPTTVRLLVVDDVEHAERVRVTQLCSQ